MEALKKVLDCLKRNGLHYTLLKIFTKLGGPFRKILLVGYYGDARNRLDSYERRFDGRARPAAVRMIWWNFKQLFKLHVDELPDTKAENERHDRQDLAEFSLRTERDLTNDKLNVAFVIDGGLGDFLIFANYLWYLREKYKQDPLRVDVYFVKGIVYAPLLFEEGGICDGWYEFDEHENYGNAYDVFFFLSRYPDAKSWNAARVMDLSPDFLEYIFLCRRFRDENIRFFDRLPECDGQSALLSVFRGQTRLQQPDIYGFLRIRREYDYILPNDKNETKRLKRFDLDKKKYITLHYGTELGHNLSVKMWPHRYFSELAGLIKTEFPEILVVQYGVNAKSCPPMENTNINLVGKTNILDVETLLRHSLIHVDCDGGMIHLRHAICGGPSIALYGPLNADFFSYAENINFTGQAGCSEPCEWLTGNWWAKCAAGYAEPPCMTSITPELVMGAVRELLTRKQEKWN